MNTTAPTSNSINPNDILGLFSKNRQLILTGTILCAVLFTMAAFTLPKRYKSSFVLTIYSNYFQNPLTRDFTSEIIDSMEMRAQREALIRQSMTAEFVDSLGVKYGMYGARAKGPLQRFMEIFGEKYKLDWNAREMRTRSEERKELMSRIQIMNLNSNTFQVSFLNSDPDVTFHVIQDIDAQVTEGLMHTRRNNLNAVYDSIEKRLESLSEKLPSMDAPTGQTSSGMSSAPERAIVNPPDINEELADVRRQLRMVSMRYTDEHPSVKDLRDREKSLVALAGSAASTGNTSGMARPEKPLSVRIPQDAAEEIYRELSKKLNYLNVALDSDQRAPAGYFATLESPLYPSSPIWPKKGLFLLWGLAIGFFGSLFITMIRDYFSRTAFRTSTLSQLLNVPMLGEIPVIYWGSAFPAVQRSRN